MSCRHNLNMRTTGKMSAQSSRRRILLAVTGLSPQIITETLYALAVAREEPWIPDEVRLITTVDGAERARLSLLSEEPAWFRKMVEDYQLPPIRFDAGCIHIVPAADGTLLRDIRTPEDNTCAADFICEQVRELTTDPDTELHVSIAGGRKTMGYYLGYALSLFGRPRDRLSHVLVSEPFESCWDFFYPTPYSRVVETRDQSLADTKDAKVTLAEIPFVSLRHGLDERLLDGASSFSEVVSAARRALGPPELVIDLPGKMISAGGVLVKLPPSQLALLSVFARRAMENRPPLPAPMKDVPDDEWAERFLAEYDEILDNPMDGRERTLTSLSRGMDGDYFSQQKSALQRSLKKALGNGALPYLIDDGGKRPREYRITLPASAIHYMPLGEHHKPVTRADETGIQQNRDQDNEARRT